MSYPAKTWTIDVLLEVGRRAAVDNNAEHPEDVGYAMTFAIETAALTLKVLMERGELR